MDNQVVAKVTLTKPENETHESFGQRVKDDLAKAGHVVLEVVLVPLEIFQGLSDD